VLYHPENYHFTLHATGSLLVGITFVLLGCYVIVRERASSVGVIFLLFSLSTSIWAGSFGMVYASLQEQQAFAWMRFSQTGVTLIPYLSVLLAMAVMQNLHHHRTFIVVNGAASLLFCLGAAFSRLHIAGQYHYDWGYYPMYGPLATLFVMYFYLLFLILVKLYWTEYRGNKHERHKKRLKGLIAAFCIGTLASLDFLPCYGIPYQTKGYLFMVPFFVVIIHVIIKYRLVDITPELAAARILETMQGAVIVTDLDGNIRVMNRVAEKILGRRGADLFGTPLAAILPSTADLSMNISRLEGIAERETIWNSANGNGCDVTVFSSPLTDKDGTLAGTVYVAHDITERKKMVETLREKEIHLRGILDSTADGILAVDSNGKTITTNQRFLQLWGIPPELMAAKDDDALLRFVLEQLKEPEAFIAKVRELYQSDATDWDTLEFKDGRVFERYSTPLQQQGSRFGRVWSFRDVTERHEAEARLRIYSEDLRIANEELRNFAHIASHDMRAPLVNIKGFAEELKRSVEEIEPCFQRQLPLLEAADREKIGPIFTRDIPEAIAFIGSSVSRMDNLINAILKLFRAGRRKLNPEPVHVQDLVQKILETLAHQLESRHVRIIEQKLPRIVTDRTVLEQIFGNLLDNAVKYLDPSRPGEIEVSAVEMKSEIVFRVRDNGRGMAQEDIPRAFEIFRRVGKLDAPGEGIGLAYVKSLVRLLGGRIWCESELGKGTTFSFSMPHEAAIEIVER